MQSLKPLAFVMENQFLSVTSKPTVTKIAFNGIKLTYQPFHVRPRRRNRQERRWHPDE